jgi:uncharacterized membrane protein
MNKLHENTVLSFERVLFFSDAVFAIAITLLVLEIKVPHLDHSVSEAGIRTALFQLLPKFLGFFYSFFIIGMMWIEHHRIFRYIGTYDMGLIWRNLLFLLFVAFIPFPTALFSEYFSSQTAFIMYVSAFGFAALGKIWIWHYAVSKREKLIVSEADDETIKAISRRSWAVPIVCALAIALSFIAIAFGGIMFPLIPLVANLLYRKKKEAAA